MCSNMGGRGGGSRGALVGVQWAGVKEGDSGIGVGEFQVAWVLERMHASCAINSVLRHVVAS